MSPFESDVAEMRRWQKAFFKSAHGSDERHKALDMARYYEIRVDRALERIEEGQSDLFSGAAING